MSEGSYSEILFAGPAAEYLYRPGFGTSTAVANDILSRFAVRAFGEGLGFVGFGGIRGSKPVF